MSDRLKLGLIVRLDEKVHAEFKKVAGLGLETCQLCSWAPDTLNQDLAHKVREASKATGVTVSTYWAGHTGKTVWNFLEGPETIGLVPVKTRVKRLDQIKQGADFAAMIEAPSVTTHVGFIEENPNHEEYRRLVESLCDLAEHCQAYGQQFCFETGQETPVTLLRTIEDVGTGNLGINLDPANLILYGKANPVDALDVFGSYVQGVHAKDGLYPTNGRDLGREVALGKGKVNFPLLIPKLKSLGYQNPITIEREISGDQQNKDIKIAIDLLNAFV